MNSKRYLIVEVLYGIILSAVFLLLMKAPLFYLAGDENGIGIGFIVEWNIILSPVWIFAFSTFEEELDLFMFSAHRYGSIKKWWKRVAIRITLHILLIYTLISAMFMIFSDDDRLVHSQNSEVRRISELTDIRVMILITAHAFVFLTAWLILRLFIKNAVISTILLLVLEDISVIYVSKMFSNTLFIPSAWGIFGMSDVISKGGYNIWMAVFIEIVFYIVAVFLLGRKLRNLHSLNT